MTGVPTVSVIMTAYNAGPYLRPAIDGLLAQTFPDFEIVVVENGSTDGTRAGLAAYGDSRLRVIELDENIGRTPALNLALENARGRYVANQDADDTSLPTRLEKQVAYLDGHPDCVLVASWCDFIDETGARIGVFGPPAGSAYEVFPVNNPISHSAAMFRRDSAVAVGGYPADFPFAQDAALWLKLAARGDAFVLPETLAQVRRHGGNLTVNPKSALARTDDAVRYFQRAIELPNLPRESVAKGRAALAVEFVNHARAQAACGNWRVAALSVSRGIACDPLAIVRRSLERLSGRNRTLYQ